MATQTSVVMEFRLSPELSRGVGIGMAGHSGIHGASARYFVQVPGSTNLNIPGMSGNKQAIISLAEKVGEYLNVPVDREPRMVFFKGDYERRGGRGSTRGR